MTNCMECGHPGTAHDCGGTECWIDTATGTETWADPPTRCRCWAYIPKEAGQAVSQPRGDDRP